MKVLIISPCGLPIPAVKGGAVLTLIESLIIQNEKSNDIEFSIIGSYDADAVEKAKKYKKSEFTFIRPVQILENIDNCYQQLIWKIKKQNHGNPRRYLWKTYVIRKIRKILLSNSYDRVVFQNAGYLLNVLKDKAICDKYEGKLYYHVHNDVPDNIYVDGLKKCKILSISAYLKKKIDKVCGCNVDKQFFVLKNGFDCSRYQNNLTEEEIQNIKCSVGIPVSKKVVLFAGRIDPSKGIEELVSAFSQLNREDAVLVIVGSTNFGRDRTSLFEKKMKQKFAELGEKVVFTGYVPYQEMWKYYKLADVAVLPSIWEEPAGLTMIEASAAGTPLITTMAGGIPEYIDGEYAILLERDEYLIEKMAEAINTVLNQESIWREKARVAQRIICGNYNEKKFYDSFISLLS
ncbi:MAG: glycosyltransferase family 4 protein [Bacteroides thetaiotaomicron]|nr:glycosyltransferase family 4 protein [Bacteroides thetaiotaomicron]